MRSVLVEVKNKKLYKRLSCHREEYRKILE